MRTVLYSSVKILLAVTWLAFLTTHPTFAQNVIDPGVVGGGNGAIDGRDIHQLPTLIIRIITFLIAISGVVTIILIIVGGIRMILSLGDPKALQSARSSVTFAIIGLVVILLSVAIITIIGNLLGVSLLNVLTIHIGS